MAAKRERSHTSVMFPRHRMDALADGIFGVAMTLLVLEIRVPDGVNPHTDGELIALLNSLWPKIWPYALSFAVLGVRWRALIQDRTSHAAVSLRYVNWSLINLLLVTFVPFSTLVLGRYASLAPAVWLYAANLAGMALAGWRVARAAPEEERAAADDNLLGLVIFLISAAAAVGLSFLHTPWATLGFALNALSPLVERWDRRRTAQAG